LIRGRVPLPSLFEVGAGGLHREDRCDEDHEADDRGARRDPRDACSLRLFPPGLGGGSRRGPCAHCAPPPPGDLAGDRPRTSDPPVYRAFSPSSCSMRSSWLYLAVRSPRLGAPAFSWPAFVATARSAIVVSSVSPLRWLITTPKLARCASAIASSVSVSVPI